MCQVNHAIAWGNIRACAARHASAMSMCGDVEPGPTAAPLRPALSVASLCCSLANSACPVSIHMSHQIHTFFSTP